MPDPRPAVAAAARATPWTAWILPALVGGLILCVAVWPLDISPGRAIRGLGSMELLQLSVLDPVRNVILFLPFGLVWPGSTRESMKRLVITSALLSLSIETIQIVLPGRTVSLQDILANSAGGGTGLALRVGSIRAARWWHDTSPAQAAGAAAGLWGLTLLAINGVDYGMRQLRWPADHDVLVGNRDTRRAWCVVVDDFDLTVGDGTATGLRWASMDNDPCPDAQRRMAPLPPETGRAVAAGSPVTFTLTATPERTDRWGPARIVEIARPRSREEGSLMIAQEGADLEVRVRRPLAGKEGRRPYYHLPDAFTAGAPTEITVHLAPDSVVVRAGGAAVVHKPRLTSEWWMLFDRVVRWRPRRSIGAVAEVLFWLGVAAPTALALGLSGAVARKPWIGLAGCMALWLTTRVPGLLPPSAIAGSAALAFPAVFLCLWFAVGAVLAPRLASRLLRPGIARVSPPPGSPRTGRPEGGPVRVPTPSRQAD